MQRHPNRPWISLLVLVAVAGSLLAWPAPASRAQTTTFPGQSEPIGNRPGALTQFPDDELVLVSDVIEDPRVNIQQFSPGSDYTLADGPTADALQYPPGMVGHPPSYQRQFDVARGRIVDPGRDVALALTKLRYEHVAGRMEWSLQELSFAGNHSATPKTVPPFAWSTTMLTGEMTGASPGALAVGDLDRAADANGAPHAEAVVAHETSYNGQRQIRLGVVSYSAAAGQATETAKIENVSATGYAYTCSAGWVSRQNAACPQHPGTIDVALADIDGDGFTEIGLLVQEVDPYQESRLQLYLYSYCPPDAERPPSLAPRAYCPPSADAWQLQPRGSTFIQGQHTYGHAPAELAAGDLDGDGDEELAAVAVENVQYDSTRRFNMQVGEMHLFLVAWNGSAPKVVFNFNYGYTPAWNDGRSGVGREDYRDVRIVAGLFKFDPAAGYDLGRRQLAIAYVEYDRPNDVSLTLHDVEALYSIARGRTYYESTCSSTHIPISLVAGNLAGTPADPSKPLWGLGLSVPQHNEVKLVTYRVDQNIGPPFGLGSFTRVAEKRIPTPVTSPTCDAPRNRNSLVALDFDGDALQLGTPAHMVVQLPQTTDFILQEPPQHLDYFPAGGWANVSRRDDFSVGYTTTSGQSFEVNTSNNSSFNVGGSASATVSAGVGADVGIVSARADVSATAKLGYDYDENASGYTGGADSYRSSLATSTAGGDALQMRSKVIDIWRYPIYGYRNAEPTLPNTYYDLYLPRANNTPAQLLDDLQAQAFGYQPVHENGNVLSYPAAPQGSTYTPSDLGPWLLPEGSAGVPGAVRCENDTRWCLSTPISEAARQFNWGRTNSSLELAIDHSTTGGTTREYTHKISGSADVKASAEVEVLGSKASASAEVELHGGYNWGAGSTQTNTSSETDQLTINVPASRDSTTAYQFTPVMYVTDNGTIKVGHGAGVDGNAAFWQRYAGADAALNLPRKFNQPVGADTWEINKQWIDAQQIRGFWVRSTTPNALGTYDVLTGAHPGERVTIETRVYNYSIRTPLTGVPVQLAVEPVDPQRNYQAIGSRVVVSNVTTGTIPYHGQVDGTGKVLANHVPVTFALDTDALPQTGNAIQTYRVWVVLNPQDPANTTGETHGWRQANVILTPPRTLNAGAEITLDVQDAAGKVLETVSYESIGTDDNIAAGLVAALRESDAFTSFGAQASVQDSSTTAPSVVVYKRGTQPPASGENRAGLVDGNAQLFFVPRATSTGVSLLTASNLEYGQNNEGWGLLTVANTAPGTSTQRAGARQQADACGPAQPEAATGTTDLELRERGLEALPADHPGDGSRVVVQAGEQVPLRVTAHSNTHSLDFERVTVYQGAPAAANIAGTALIRGIQGECGGHDWLSWQAPQQPGTYKLVAQLHEDWHDTQAGDNLDTVEIVVEAGPQRPYHVWLSGISRAR